MEPEEREKPVLEELARCNSIRFTSIYVVAFFLLLWLSNSTVVLSASLLVFSFFVAEAVSNAIENALPRRIVDDPESKAVFITGCDTGFGNALARRLDTLGFTVYAGCLHPKENEALQLSESTSARCETIYVDVTKQSTLDDARKHIEDTLGNKTLWAIVNNAGIGAFTEIEWCPVEIYQKILDVNALGPIRATKTFLPLLRKSEGRIIMVASLAGRYTFPGSSAYSMSKCAVVSFADGLRREMVKWGITIHTVEPTAYRYIEFLQTHTKYEIYRLFKWVSSDRTPLSAEKNMKKNLQNIWDKLPEDIKESYGSAYYQDFLLKLKQFSDNARPKEKIAEVIDDLVDAVAGAAPLGRYVPNIITQLRARLICALPTGAQDALLCKIAAPSTPPAAAPPKRESSLSKSLKGLKERSLYRQLSMPMFSSVPKKSDPKTEAPTTGTPLLRMKEEESQHFKF
ncbi:unnamed protein product [Notodromas monacha]|uniref:Uncharacterized protein n=1 Tax=Notodromas monacha TaxID=399045 RepID=A0A7R9BY94_9CRUS|nr:unnamed protein product [Notodromas monacha]CAG0924000.1 unnamed protein product [Notodromas monacha]